MPEPVPGSHQVVASLTPHNGQAVGAIGMIDTHQGKNDLEAVFNFTPEYPVEMDQGLAVGPVRSRIRCPRTQVLISNNAIGGHGILELVGRDGCRELVYCDPADLLLRADAGQAAAAARGGHAAHRSRTSRAGSWWPTSTRG